MPQNIDLEIAVIKKFVVRNKQERYLKFISTPKNRYKFISQLAHFNDFKWHLFEQATGNEAEVIQAALEKYKQLKTAYKEAASSEINMETLIKELQQFPRLNQS